jgi:hypothetical protein
MQVDFNSLWPLALLFLGKSSSAGSPALANTPKPTGATVANEVPRVQTGGNDRKVWAIMRYETLLYLIQLSGYVAEPDRQKDIALSLLAQWAHECARGKNEFNYNMGGWMARKGDVYFTARDVQSGTATVHRWTAYPDLNTGMLDQIQRLFQTFPSAAKLLMEQPKNSRWVEELGKRGYYSALPSQYARAWAMNRAELAQELGL